MCGIVGLVRNDGKAIDEALVARMNDAIRHRGPDEDGFYFNGSVGLAMRRLAIIDLKSGQQPIHNRIAPPGSFSTARSTTTSSYAKSSKSWATPFTQTATPKRSFTPTINMALIVPSICVACLLSQSGIERTQELFLARDRVGKKPLLYAEVNGQLVFGSEFSAFLLHPDISREIRPEAIDHYLSFMCVPAPLTAYQANQKVRARTLAPLAQRRGED